MRTTIDVVVLQTLRLALALAVLAAARCLVLRERPQSATYHVAVWLSEARHFSHQQRLAQGVVFALTGQQPERSEANVQAHAAAPTLPLSVPADAVLKKIELALAESDRLTPPINQEFFQAESVIVFIGRLRPPPPHSPPRALS